MPSMPIYFVGKGSQFLMLDQQFNNPPGTSSSPYGDALNRIDRPLSDLAADHADPSSGVQPGLTDGDANHFASHWLGSWWPHKPVEQVLRVGYREAIKRATTTNKPIESIWVCADEDEFQVYICEGPRQVTVIVFTPPPPKHRGLFSKKREHSEEKLTQDEPIWVVKVKDKHDDEYTRLGASDYEMVDDANKIITRQIRYAP
jgi:hypothetical protein